MLRVPAILLCALAVIAGAATLAMLEPMLALWYQQRLGLTPGRIGLLFAGGAVSSAVGNIAFGRLSDRWGGRPLTLAGLVMTAALMPLLTYAPTPLVAALLMVASFAGFALVVTPSLAFIAEAAAAARVESHGVVYGVYNVAWAIGLLVGPAIGGWLYERIGLRATTFLWSPALVLVTLALARVRVAAPSAVVPREPSA